MGSIIAAQLRKNRAVTLLLEGPLQTDFPNNIAFWFVFQS